MLRALPTGKDGWTAHTDIQTLFFRLTIDSATEFLFGSSVNSQIAHLPESISGSNESSDDSRTDEKAFSTNFDSAQRYIAKRFRLANLYWMLNPKEFKDNNKMVNDFIGHYVDIALRTKAGKAEEKSNEEGHAKETYVFLNELSSQTQDPVELRAQLLNILLGKLVV